MRQVSQNKVGLRNCGRDLLNTDVLAYALASGGIRMGIDTYLQTLSDSITIHRSEPREIATVVITSKRRL